MKAKKILWYFGCVWFLSVRLNYNSSYLKESHKKLLAAAETLREETSDRQTDQYWKRASERERQRITKHCCIFYLKVEKILIKELHTSKFITLQWFKDSCFMSWLTVLYPSHLNQILKNEMIYTSRRDNRTLEILQCSVKERSRVLSRTQRNTKHQF